MFRGGSLLKLNVRIDTCLVYLFIADENVRKRNKQDVSFPVLLDISDGHPQLF